MAPITSSPRLSRRSLLAASALTTTGTLLGACGAQTTVNSPSATPAGPTTTANPAGWSGSEAPTPLMFGDFTQFGPYIDNSRISDNERVSLRCVSNDGTRLLLNTGDNEHVLYDMTVETPSVIWSGSTADGDVGFWNNDVVYGASIINGQTGAQFPLPFHPDTNDWDFLGGRGDIGIFSTGDGDHSKIIAYSQRGEDLWQTDSPWGYVAPGVGLVYLETPDFEHKIAVDLATGEEVGRASIGLPPDGKSYFLSVGGMTVSPLANGGYLLWVEDSEGAPSGTLQARDASGKQLWSVTGVGRTKVSALLDAKTVEGLTSSLATGTETLNLIGDGGQLHVLRATGSTVIEVDGINADLSRPGSFVTDLTMTGQMPTLEADLVAKGTMVLIHSYMDGDIELLNPATEEGFRTWSMGREYGGGILMVPQSGGHDRFITFQEEGLTLHTSRNCDITDTSCTME